MNPVPARAHSGLACFPPFPGYALSSQVLIPLIILPKGSIQVDLKINTDLSPVQALCYPLSHPVLSFSSSSEQDQALALQGLAALLPALLSAWGPLCTHFSAAA